MKRDYTISVYEEYGVRRCDNPDHCNDFVEHTRCQKFGTTVLTSAGVIGIIAGVAAQKSIANFITGFQIAYTQPMKIGDEIIIEDEFGTIEDITLTYVVVKTWDLRRMVLPLHYFNEQPFVNWSYNSPDLIGSVFFYVDYIFPAEALRKALLANLKDNPLWDKKSAELLVTDAIVTTLQLRVTISAKNASNAWRLRRGIREHLIGFIQEKYPDALPQLRQKIFDMIHLLLLTLTSGFRNTIPYVR